MQRSGNISARGCSNSSPGACGDLLLPGTRRHPLGAVKTIFCLTLGADHIFEVEGLSETILGLGASIPSEISRPRSLEALTKGFVGNDSEPGWGLRRQVGVR